MKTKILNTNKKIEMPKIFSSSIREDICQKVYEAEKKWQPYAPFFMAGKQHSASGKIRHARRLWKTSYGHGISRVPKKALWRRGTQFYWVGAEVSGTRGGRHARIPRVEHFQKVLKINKKEKLIAFNSAIASTASLDYIRKRYSTFDKEIKLPMIIDSDFLKKKTKEFLKIIKENLKEVYEFSENRKLLLVIGKNESYKTKLFQVRRVNELEIKNLYPLGRMVIYTEEAVKELGERKEKSRNLQVSGSLNSKESKK
jgi:ribosomal protein L4